MELLREAPGLWRGEPLSDLPADLFRDVASALAERRLDALELRIDADLALGRHAEVLPELRALIGAHPLRERFWAQRMRALSRCGRHGEALECYREVASLLAGELGIDPGAELWDLHRRYLGAQEPGVPPRRRVCGAGNLPAETTSFVGREAQPTEVRRALEGSRLVTLTGAGGVGKTRLALRVAADVAPGLPDGAWLADLAPYVILGGAAESHGGAEAFQLPPRRAPSVTATSPSGLLRGRSICVMRAPEAGGSYSWSATSNAAPATAKRAPRSVNAAPTPHGGRLRSSAARSLEQGRGVVGYVGLHVTR